MIVSASRRTDLPAVYPDWLFNRLSAGYALARNPMSPRQISRVSLLARDVDGIVFWTKNAAPMLERLDALAPFAYYFQYTITAYGQDVEPGPCAARGRAIDAFLRLSDRLGPERVIWRYDPILLNDTYTADFHAEAFYGLARRLSGVTARCVISFVDQYRCAQKALSRLGVIFPDPDTMRDLARIVSGSARAFGMRVESCSEEALAGTGVERGCCVDAALLSRLSGRPLKITRDRNQRPSCGCAPSVDIGAYDTCTLGCAYCYASHSARTLAGNLAAHHPSGELLFGRPGPQDTVRTRR